MHLARGPTQLVAAAFMAVAVLSILLLTGAGLERASAAHADLRIVVVYDPASGEVTVTQDQATADGVVVNITASQPFVVDVWSSETDLSGTLVATGGTIDSNGSLSSVPVVVRTHAGYLRPIADDNGQLFGSTSSVVYDTVNPDSVLYVTPEVAIFSAHLVPDVGSASRVESSAALVVGYDEALFGIWSMGFGHTDTNAVGYGSLSSSNADDAGTISAATQNTFGLLTTNVAESVVISLFLLSMFAVAVSVLKGRVTIRAVREVAGSGNTHHAFRALT